MKSNIKDRLKDVKNSAECGSLFCKLVRDELLTGKYKQVILLDGDAFAFYTANWNDITPIITDEHIQIYVKSHIGFDETTLYIWSTSCKPYIKERLYPEYKANRNYNAPDREKTEIIKNSVHNLSTKGNMTLEMLGFEADDVLSTIALEIDDIGISTYIISSDRDYNVTTDLCLNVKLVWKQEVISTPTGALALKMLSGDASDNIKPYVEGLGKKTAVVIMNMLKKAGIDLSEIMPEREMLIRPLNIKEKNGGIL